MSKCHVVVRSSEGAYFFNPYVGVGGRFSVTRTPVIVDGVKAEDNVFDTWKVGGGAYFSYPLTSRWLLGSKLLASSVFYLYTVDGRVDRFAPWHGSRNRSVSDVQSTPALQCSLLGRL